MILENNHEMVGTLSVVKHEKNVICCTFSIDKNIEIPGVVVDLKQLTELIGVKIGILNYDGGIKIRKIK